MWTTSVPILVFLCLSVLDLELMYARDIRQTSDTHQRFLCPIGAGQKNEAVKQYSKSSSMQYLTRVLPEVSDSDEHRFPSLSTSDTTNNDKQLTQA